jgi:signal transduction histidine kinase
MPLDIRTLLVAVAVVAAFSAAARFMLWRLHRGIPGLVHWLWASIISMVSLGLLSLAKGSFLYLWLSLGPILLALGYALVWEGFRRFTGRPSLGRRTLLLLLAISLLSISLNNLGETMAFRAAMNAAVASIISAIIAAELLTFAGRRQVAMRVTAFVYATNALFFLIRTINYLTNPDIVGPLNIDNLSVASALWWLGMPLATTLCMVLMAGERLQLDVENKMRILDEVTAQKLAEERLRLMEKEGMEVTLRQWMADTSHELRTPLSVLRAQIEAIQDGVTTADSKRLNVLHGEVMGMTRLVEDLFTLARSDIGQLEIRSAPVDVVDVLDGVIHSFRERYDDARIGLQWPGYDGGGPVVAGDGARLKQVFSNLLENSLRYTDTGGLLRVSYAAEDGRVRFLFDDSAPSVSPDMLPRLFDRFFRVDASRNRANGGSGIGLALCQTVVEAHGGAICAESSPLGGLRIGITLPRL